MALHQAVNVAPEGSILVIDAHGFTNAGAFGDIMATIGLDCIKRGFYISFDNTTENLRNEE